MAEIAKRSLRMTNKQAWAFFVESLPWEWRNEAWGMRYRMKRQAGGDEKNAGKAVAPGRRAAGNQGGA